MSIKSKGSIVQLEIASVFTEISALQSVSHQGTDVEVFEDTDYNQAAAGKTYNVTGYVEGGNVPFTRFFDPVGAIDQALTDLLTTPAVVNWKIIWSDTAATAWAFTGILTKADVTTDKANGLMQDCDVKCSGLVTYPT